MNIKLGSIVNTKKVIKVLKYNIWYNKDIEQPAGQNLLVGAMIAVSDSGKPLPPILKKPKNIKQHEAFLVVLERGS